MDEPPTLALDFDDDWIPMHDRMDERLGLGFRHAARADKNESWRNLNRCQGQFFISRRQNISNFVEPKMNDDCFPMHDRMDERVGCQWAAVTRPGQTKTNA